MSDILSISFGLTSSLSANTDMLISTLPFGTSEQERLRSIKNDKALSLSLSALLALKSLIDMQDKPIESSQLTILRSANRKPYFKDLDLFFSLSHTDGIALCALCHKPVGIDIEWIDEKVNFLDISKRFFSAEEQAYVSESASPLLAFYSLWTKKEACAKLTGEGLISVCKGNPSNIGFCKQYLLEYNGKRGIISLCCTKADDVQIHGAEKELVIYELNTEEQNEL